MHTYINTYIHMCMYMYTYTHNASGVNSLIPYVIIVKKYILSSPVLGCPSSLHTTRASTLLH